MIRQNAVRVKWAGYYWMALGVESRTGQAGDIDHDMIAGIGRSIERKRQDAGIEPLIHATQIGSRSDIWSIILGGTIPTKAIQTAFETSGIAYDPVGTVEELVEYCETGGCAAL